MKTNLFSPILILLIFVLFAKASVLFGHIQEQTTYNSDVNNGTSMIVDTAYATNSEEVNSSLEQDNPSTDVKNKVDAGESLTQQIAKSDINNKQQSHIISDQSINHLTKSEIELLKELSKRREKLEIEKKDMDIREQVLKVTEGKIDQKVSELKGLQSQLEELMKQYSQKENSKILSLVKIYETMKPKDAAKIFNELEMPVLIKVVSNMKEVKVAPIIADMEPSRARDLSIELAKQDPLE
jgi:flagellar motility protein MotE (MotC chaperone)